MANNNKEFLRQPDDYEKRLISKKEEEQYPKELRSVIIILAMAVIAIVAGILAFFLPMNWSILRRIVCLVLGAALLYVSLGSLPVFIRQHKKIQNEDYKVQSVTIIDVHNQKHGLVSDQIVTFKSEDGNTYELNTHTTGDGRLVLHSQGLLVIINGEKNILLTAKYRFYAN